MEEKPRQLIRTVVESWVKEAYLNPYEVDFPEARYEGDDEDDATRRAVEYCEGIMAKIAVEIPRLADILDSETYNWGQPKRVLTKYFKNNFWSCLTDCYEPIERPPLLEQGHPGIGFDLEKHRREAWLTPQLPMWPAPKDEHVRSLENWGGVMMLVVRTIQNPRNYFHGMSFGQFSAMPASLYTDETLLEVESEMARRAELAKQQTQ